MMYGLIGERLSHSYSKIIHEYISEYNYELIELPKEQLETYIKSGNYSGLNVTIPYKQDVIPYLNIIDEKAKLIGAVNTIVNHDGTLIGYNTDFDGLLYTIQKNNIEITNKKVLILGSGGASKAARAVVSYLNCNEYHLVNRYHRDNIISYEESLSLHRDADIIINTTPVGMYPIVDASPLDISPYTSLSALIDIIYNPLTTLLMKQARSLNIKAVNGLEMLVAQAKSAAELFLNTSIDNSIIELTCNYLLDSKIRH